MTGDIISVYGDLNAKVWERQSNNSNRDPNQFYYKNQPLNSDWSVYIGNAGFEKKNLISQNKSIFVLLEPPEIYEYQKKDLEKFDYILGPEFNSYMNWNNYIPTPCIVPPSIGMDYSETRMNTYFKKILPSRLHHKLKSQMKVNLELSKIFELNFEKERKVTIITSSKIDTPGQKRRLDFIEFIKKNSKIPIEIFGRGIRDVSDKFSVLQTSTHHIALENSIHKKYWTEKFSDSLLSLNHTFYSGAPDITEKFDTNSVTRINLDDFESALSKIEDKFLNHSIDYEVLEKDRQKLKSFFLFEPVILNFISSLES